MFRHGLVVDLERHWIQQLTKSEFKKHSQAFEDGELYINQCMKLS